MAVFLGGIALLGYDPGPHMMRNNLDITYTIVWSLALANVFGAGLCVALSSQIARLTTIRFTLVAPFLFMVIAFAAFQSRQSLGDLVALMAVGVIGIFLRRFEWSRPAFLIGFVLSSQAEAFANMANQIAVSRFHRSFEQGIQYIASPITLVILALTIVSIIIGIRQGRYVLGSDDPPTGTKRAPLVFLICITGYMLVAWVDALSISRMGDKIFPVTVGTVTLIGCLVLLVRMIRAPEGDPIFTDLERGGEDGGAPHGLWSTLGWFAFLLAASSLLGFVLALTIFFVAFLRMRARVSWTRTLVLSTAAIALICFLAGSLGRDFPPGLLQEVADLPWPLT
jgi:hypothetical protein